MPSKKKRRARAFPAAIVAFTVLAVCAIAVIAYFQEQKLAQIQSQHEALLQEYEALLEEEQRLESMIGYTKTEDFMLQYAREVLGYVLPGDIKFILPK